SLIVSRGIAHDQLGNERQAISDYGEAIRLDPQDFYAHYNRGIAHQKVGDRRSAVKDFSEAIRIRPKDADAYVNRGLMYLDTGKFDEAIADFSRAHDLDSDDIWSLANRGITYAWKKDRMRAEQDFKAVRTIDPVNPVLLRGEALLAIDAGDPSTAVKLLSESLRREPDNIWALQMRAEMYLQLGENEKSWADSDKADQLRRDKEKSALADD
ncbi:MAG TPA: tetratricopeptide repeat protein, partial [Sphingomicrobium sp.]|nr:tetratricopeptide repeat protein [Sphingomicrobium sp.]